MRASALSLTIAAAGAGASFLGASPPAGDQPRSAALPPDAFVTALARDPRGALWAATEDLGLFRLGGGGAPTEGKENGVLPPDPPLQAGRAPDPLRFTSRSGLTDDTACALAFDAAGRLWVGTLNRGVSVWNGEAWRHYDVPDGPLGERVFDIACNPADGDVWIATSAGLTRYRAARDRWDHYTRADGLPSDLAAALAFARDGTLYVGTQCHGIAYARPVPVNKALEYYTWSVAAAPDRFGPDGCSPVPLEPAGTGLPSNLINDLLVGRDGTVWAATTAGLAWSRNGGTSWRFLRGRDWEGKVRGLLGGPPKGWRPPDPRRGAVLLPEDRVTCLAEDDQGLIWLGHWRKGYTVFAPRTAAPVYMSAHPPDPTGREEEFVSAICPVPGGPPWIGWYGGGLTRGGRGGGPCWEIGLPQDGR